MSGPEREPRPKWALRGKKILNDKQRRIMAGEDVEDSINDDSTASLDESIIPGVIKRKLPTRAELEAIVGATQKRHMDAWNTGLFDPNRELPPVQLSTSPPESSDESSYDDENEKENNGEPPEQQVQQQPTTSADEATPLAEQRDQGRIPMRRQASQPLVETPKSAKTTVKRVSMGPPSSSGPSSSTRHILNSTPKATGRQSYMDTEHALAHLEISAIERRSSEASATLHVESRAEQPSGTSVASAKFKIDARERSGVQQKKKKKIEEVVEEEQEGQMEGTFTVQGAQQGDGASAVNKESTAGEERQEGTFIVDRVEPEPAENGPFVVQPAPAAAAALMMTSQELMPPPKQTRRSIRPLNDVSMQSVHEEGVRTRRSIRPLNDVTMASVEDEEREEEEGASELEAPNNEAPGGDSIEDVEMVSVPHTPVMRKGKRSSIPAVVGSSPGAAFFSQLSKRPATQPARISTDSVSSSIQYEPVNDSRLSADNDVSNSFVEPVTPARTPRTQKQYRESIAARQSKQEQEGQSMQGGPRAVVGSSLDAALARLGKRKTTQPARISIDSASDSIQYEPVNDSRMSADNNVSSSFVEPVTPARTPRTQKLYRESIASRDLRLQLERQSLQGGPRESQAGPRATMTSPFRQPLTPRLQESVDRLSKPKTPLVRPCGREARPSSAQSMRPPISPAFSTRPPAQTHTPGYTSQYGMDVSSMLDEVNQKSGLAMRLRPSIRPSIGGRDFLPRPLNLSNDGDEQQNTASAQQKQSRRQTMLLQGLDAVAVSQETMQQQKTIVEDEEEEKEEEEEETEENDEMETTRQRMSHAQAVASDDNFTAPLVPSRSATINSSMSSIRPISPHHASSNMGASNIASSTNRTFNGGSPEHSAFSNGPDPVFYDDVLTPPPVPRKKSSRMFDNDDLFTTATPGIHRGRAYIVSSEEDVVEENSMINDSMLADDSMLSTRRIHVQAVSVSSEDSSQASLQSGRNGEERELKTRKLIVPTNSPPMPGQIRKSTRNRMKPVRTWLNERPQYAVSPGGSRTLKGATKVVVTDKFFVQAGTADIKRAFEVTKDVQKRRQAEAKKRKLQKIRNLEERHRHGRDLNTTVDSIVTSDEGESD